MVEGEWLRGRRKMEAESHGNGGEEEGESEEEGKE